MISLLLVITFLGVLLVLALFLLGFRLGVHQATLELLRVRTEATQARRQIGDLTRQAFVAMAEEAERRRPS